MNETMGFGRDKEADGSASGAGGSGPTALAFDTSSSVLAAAITRGGHVADSSQSFTERNHSVRVVPDLQELLRRNGLQARDVDFIAVGQGPGSYTGVRIAVTAAKTLAWTWGKPLLGVSSLEAMAFGAWRKESGEREPDGDVWFVPLVDARRGQVYTARFVASGGEWRRAEEDGIRLLADWLATLNREAKERSDRTAPAAIVFTGELASLEGKWDPETASVCGVPFRTRPMALEAGAVGLLAEQRYMRGERDDVHGFVPNYTQLTEAEVNLAKSRTESAT